MHLANLVYEVQKLSSGCAAIFIALLAIVVLLVLILEHLRGSGKRGEAEDQQKGEVEVMSERVAEMIAVVLLVSIAAALIVYGIFGSGQLACFAFGVSVVSSGIGYAAY